MQIRYQQSPDTVRTMSTAQLRENFLIQELFKKDKVSWVYTHYDRVMVGGAKPVNQKIQLVAHPELKTSYLLERRELGIINVGGKGSVTIDNKKFSLTTLDGIYIGKGVKKVILESETSKQPALFYLVSAPAHHSYPVRLISKEKAAPAPMGTSENSNKRIIYKYIHEEGVKSCQLVMGLTLLESASVWNSFPPHTHDRRMEVYFYFNLSKDNQVYHFMGQPQETRHLVVANNEAVISPPWGMHYGCGTSNYGFIWAMAGENQAFADMDHVASATIR